MNRYASTDNLRNPRPANAPQAPSGGRSFSSGGGRLFQSIRERVRIPNGHGESPPSSNSPATPTPSLYKFSRGLFLGGSQPQVQRSAPKPSKGDDPWAFQIQHAPDPPQMVKRPSRSPINDQEFYAAILQLQGRGKPEEERDKLGIGQEEERPKTGFRVRYDSSVEPHSQPPSPVRSFTTVSQSTTSGGSQTWQLASPTQSRRGSIDIKAPPRLSERAVLPMRASHFAPNCSFISKDGTRSSIRNSVRVSSNLAQHHVNSSNSFETDPRQVRPGRNKARLLETDRDSLLHSRDEMTAGHGPCMLGCGSGQLVPGSGICDICQPKPRPVAPLSGVCDTQPPRPHMASPLSSRASSQIRLSIDEVKEIIPSPRPKDGFDSDSSSDYDDYPVTQSAPTSPQRAAPALEARPQTPPSPLERRTATIAERRQQRQHERRATSVSPTPKTALRMHVIAPRQFRQVSISSPVKSPTRYTRRSSMKPALAEMSPYSPAHMAPTPALVLDSLDGLDSFSGGEPSPGTKVQRADAFASLCSEPSPLMSPPPPPPLLHMDESPSPSKRYTKINDIYDDYL